MSITSMDKDSTEIFLDVLSRAGHDDLCLRIKRNENMSSHTTMRVGGPADLYVEPAGLLEAAALYNAAGKSGLPCFIMGNGSNLVVSDQGIEGLVIQFGSDLSRIWYEVDPKDDSAVLV